MTDSLRDKLVAVLSGVATVNLSEDAKDSYPWVVYDMTTHPIMDKDGICGYSGDATIRLVDKDPDALDTLRASVENAIATGMRDSAFSSKLNDITKECVEDVWTIELTYTLKQYADWEQPTPEENVQTNTD
jgi:hypothetical protein